MSTPAGHPSQAERLPYSTEVVEATSKKPLQGPNSGGGYLQVPSDGLDCVSEVNLNHNDASDTRTATVGNATKSLNYEIDLYIP